MANWQELVNALEDKKYKWRTIRGIANQLNVTTEEIQNLLQQHSSEIIKSSIPAETGEELYTTRKHYRKTTSAIDKLLSSLSSSATSASSSSSSSEEEDEEVDDD